MGWEQLGEIIKQNRAVQQAERAAPPAACPIDGHVLDVHPDGRRNCPLGNYRWPDQKT